MGENAPTGIRTAVSGHAEVVNTHLGNASFALGMAENLAQGNYGQALTSAGMRVAFTPKVYEAAAELTKSVEPVAGALGWLGKNLPIVGGVVIAAYDAKEVYDHLKKGDYKGAALATVAGVAEVAGTAVLGGVGGAAAREAIYYGNKALGGKSEINHSALVSVGIEAVKLGEQAYAKGSKFMHDQHDPVKLAQEQVNVLHADGVLPKTVKMEGKEVGLDVALRNPVFNKAFRQNLEDAQKHGHLDAKPLLASIDKFDAIEKDRVAHGGNKAPAAPQVASGKKPAVATAHA